MGGAHVRKILLHFVESLCRILCQASTPQPSSRTVLSRPPEELHAHGNLARASPGKDAAKGVRYARS
jgi:hypothetical protein